MAQCTGAIRRQAFGAVWLTRKRMRCLVSDRFSYFDFLAPCFPIFEESRVRDKIKNKDELRESFLINLYAYTLSYWDSSQTLALYPRPDQDYAYVVLGDFDQGLIPGRTLMA